MIAWLGDDRCWDCIYAIYKLLFDGLAVKVPKFMSVRNVNIPETNVKIKIEINNQSLTLRKD